jgi:hypothetical protein
MIFCLHMFDLRAILVLLIMRDIRFHHHTPKKYHDLMKTMAAKLIQETFMRNGLDPKDLRH